MSHQQEEERIFPKNNKWREYVNEIISQSDKINKSVNDWYTSIIKDDKKKKIKSLWRSYVNDKDKSKEGNDYSYKDLTQYCTDKGCKWEDVHDFRETIYTSAKNLVVELNDISEQGVDAFGSKEKNSDIDITITEKPASCAIKLAYYFGLCSNMLFRNYANIPPVENVITWYLDDLFHIADIATYSSNGIIVSKEETDMLTRRYLSEIQPNKYQVIYKRKCKEQNTNFYIISYLLLNKMICLSNHCNNTNICTSVRTLINSKKIQRYLKELSTYKNEVSDIEKIIHKSPIDKFKIQITSSYNADFYAKVLTDKDVKLFRKASILERSPVKRAFNKLKAIDEQPGALAQIVDDVTTYSKEVQHEQTRFCVIAARWEYEQIKANVASPESAWAVQTFVSTVIDSQRGLGKSLIIQYDALWIVMVENLCSMIHQYNDGDYRKMYKYGMRLVSAATEITGEPITQGDTKLNKNEYDRIRVDGITEKQKSKLLNLIIFIITNIFEFSPAKVRFRIR